MRSIGLNRGLWLDEIANVGVLTRPAVMALFNVCLLYTSDAADERSSVDLGGRRIIKKKTTDQPDRCSSAETEK